MYLSIQGRHLTVTPALHDYVKNKIKKVKFYFDQIVHAHVVVSVVKNTQTAEATLSIERTHFHNKVGSEDLYKSIDMLFDKIERQIVKHKESHGHAKIGMNKRENHDKEITQAKVAVQIHEAEVDDKPMSDLEAVLQLKADPKRHHFGYYMGQNAERPSFIHQVDEKNFLVFDYDHHWEKKEVELVHPDRLQVNSIEAIKIVTEGIESAAEYLEQHTGEVRLFRSASTNTILFMAREKAGHFLLLREKIRS